VTVGTCRELFVKGQAYDIFAAAFQAAVHALNYSMACQSPEVRLGLDREGIVNSRPGRACWDITGAYLALCAAASPIPAQAPMRVDTGVAVPMRDGIVLRADLYRPAGEGRFPVLVYRTPYDRTDTAGGSSLVRAAVSRGYAVVLQDVRGRYGSGGLSSPTGRRAGTATTPSSGPPVSRGRTARSGPSDSRTPARCSGSLRSSARHRSRRWCRR
jgi:hypothetical protein